MALAYALTLLAGFGIYIGKGLQKRGVRDLPPISLHWPVLRLFLRNPFWGGGFVLEMFSSVLSIVAIGMTPISIYQPLLATGLIALVVYDRIVLRDPTTPHEWLGLALLALGAILMAATLQKGPDSFHVTRLLVAFGLLVSLLGLLECLFRRRWWLELSTGMMSGTCFGSPPSSCALRISAFSKAHTRLGSPPARSQVWYGRCSGFFYKPEGSASDEPCRSSPTTHCGRVRYRSSLDYLPFTNLSPHLPFLFSYEPPRLR